MFFFSQLLVSASKDSADFLSERIGVMQKLALAATLLRPTGELDIAIFWGRPLLWISIAFWNNNCRILRKEFRPLLSWDSEEMLIPLQYVGLQRLCPKFDWMDSFHSSIHIGDEFVPIFESIHVNDIHVNVVDRTPIYISIPLDDEPHKRRSEL